MILTYIVALLVGQQAAGRTEVPLVGWNSNDVMFTCGVKGLPSLEIDYSPTRKHIRFFQIREPEIEFELSDAVKSIFFADGANGQEWTIRAEGFASSAKGLRDQTHVAIDITVRLTANKPMMADFLIRSADFTRQETNCGLAPPRPPSRNMQ